MPLAIYTLLGNPTALPSYPRQPPAIPAVSIPAVRGFRSNSKTYLSSTSLVEKGNHLYLCCWGCSVRSFLIYCESDPPSNGENSFTSIASLVPSDEIDVSLTECLGHGFAGRVFIGTTDYKNFALQVAPWKIGRQMLQREAIFC